MASFLTPDIGDYYCMHHKAGDEFWSVSCAGSYDGCSARAREVSKNDPTAVVAVIEVVLTARPGPPVWDSVGAKRIRESS